MGAQNKKSSPIDPLAFLAGGGEMEERIRAFDWSKTPLGPAAGWPQSLKTAVRIQLNSRYPMFVWWGRELTNIYNDAYIPVLGARHPQALGRSAPDIWTDVWAVLGPQTELVLNDGRATWNDSTLLMMERYGYTEETYFTFSYSPVPDDAGGVGGVFCACTEDTQRVIGERQLALLRDLAARTADARTWQEACERSADALSSNPHDLPFALIYIGESDGSTLSLAAASGIERGHPAALNVADVVDGVEEVEPGELSPWPFAAVLNEREVVVVEELRPLAGDPLPTGAWQEQPVQAALVPIMATGQTGRGGVLVVGLNPFRLFDDDYRNFLTLVSGQIAASIAGAQAYEEEKKRAEALAELDRAKTAFFSNVSHEFRTPLTLMLGPVEEMLEKGDGDLTPATREQLEVVHRNSLRLLKLVNTMLDFSRIEAGRIQASYQALDLAHYTAELASVFRAAIERAGMRLIVNCPPLPEPVYVDRDMWEKIVLNLLSNAFKFTLEGEIEVRLEAIDGHAQLTVRDTGVGIPPAEMPRVFERFHQVQASRGRTHEGTGIGLSLVQELVRLHGGTVHAESVLNEGSQFIVTLPLGKAHLDPQRIGTIPDRRLPTDDDRPPITDDRPPTTPGAEAFVQEALRWLPNQADAGHDERQVWAWDGPERSGGTLTPIAGSGDKARPQDPRPRIIWADDNADMREYVGRLLGEQFEVEAVADGRAALDATQANPPDLVLADIMMPRLDGMELLRELRADSQLREIPVILLSARAGEEARIEGLEAGADDYLIKPFSARELMARVGTTLELARVRREAEEVLRESEERHRLVSRAANDVIWDWHYETGRVVWSENLRTVFGYTAEAAGTAIEQATTWWSERIHPDDRERTMPGLDRAIERGDEVWSGEYRFRRSDDSYAVVIDRGYIVRSEAGKPVRVIGSMQDVSGLKRVEAALRESEERFQAIFSQVTAGISQTDLTGRFVLVNDRYCDIVGYSREELLQRRMQDITHPDDLPRNVVFFHRLVSEGTPFTIEKRYIRKDGSPVWVHNAVTVTRDAAGRPQYGVAVTVDISERKQAERDGQFLAALGEKIRLAEDVDELLNVVCDMTAHHFDATHCALSEIDYQQGTVTTTHEYRDEDAASLLGTFRLADYPQERQDALREGRTLATDDTETDPSTAAVYETVYRPEGFRALLLQPVMRNGVCAGSLLLNQTRPHHWTESEINLFALVAERAWLAMEKLRSEAALRESEQRFREIFEVAGVSVWVEDFTQVKTAIEELRAQGVADFRAYFAQHPEFVQRAITLVGIVDVNQETLDLFGAQRKADLLHSLADIFTPETEPLFMEELIALAEGRDSLRAEASLRTLDGRPVSVLFTIHFAPLRGDYSRVVVTLTDITLHKQAEEVLRRLNEKLEERVVERTRQVRELASRLTMAGQEERRQISQILHDDLQQLLYGIDMKLGMIRQDLQQAESSELAALAEDLEEGRAWIQQAITTTRRLTVDLSPPILQDEGLAESLVWLQRQMQELHGLEVVVEAEHSFYLPDEDLRVLLFQSVRELLFNVKKHAGMNRATVKLSEEANYLVIHVMDEGQGFDVEAVTAGGEQGGGFGLFSIRERLNLLSGRMQIESAPGEGTRVTLIVPLPRQ